MLFVPLAVGMGRVHQVFDTVFTISESVSPAAISASRAQDVCVGVEVLAPPLCSCQQATPTINLHAGVNIIVCG